MLVVAPLLLLWHVLTAALLLLSTAYPLIEPLLHLARVDPDAPSPPLLAPLLSLAYLATLLTLIPLRLSRLASAHIALGASVKALPAKFLSLSAARIVQQRV